MDPFEHIDQEPSSQKEWDSYQSELVGIDGKKKNIKIEIMSDGMPRAVAFFDIDGTLAHLGVIHGQAIRELFKEQAEQDGEELETTYYRGFQLGNSYREFDRMKGIYVDGHAGWKDPEVYLKVRFNPHALEIDEPGHLAHNIAAGILKEYGELAAQITENLYKNHPEKFEQSNIDPIFQLARMYARIGIPMVGFTANARIFVEKLAKYLKLSDIFLDIATDETMAGGGKELAIHHLIKMLETKGLKVPKDRFIFVGDSLRGDIGTSLKANEKDSEISSGKGILVLKDREALFEIERQINADSTLRKIADSIDVQGLVLSDVPVDDQGNPMLLSRFRNQFLKKL